MIRFQCFSETIRRLGLLLLSFPIPFAQLLKVVIQVSGVLVIVIVRASNRLYAAVSLILSFIPFCLLPMVGNNTQRLLVTSISSRLVVYMLPLSRTCLLQVRNILDSCIIILICSLCVVGESFSVALLLPLSFLLAALSDGHWTRVMIKSVETYLSVLLGVDLTRAKRQ